MAYRNNKLIMTQSISANNNMAACNVWQMGDNNDENGEIMCSENGNEA